MAVIQYRFLLLLAIVISVLPFAEAREKPWLRISNAHFVALTDAKEEKALKIIEELERFRVAVRQFVDISVPENAPPFRAVIFRSRNRFHKLVGAQTVAGLVMKTEDGPIIVMHANKEKWLRGFAPSQVMRHEYVHVLASYHHAKYPCWYEEGFAEVLATAEIGDDFMLVGTQPEGRKRGLLAKQTTNIMMERCHGMYGDYGKYWLFVHYLTFSGNRHAELLRYLNLYDSGTPSLEAFKESFGTTPKEMWKDEVWHYREIPVFRVPIEMSNLDLPFTVADADPKEIQEQLRVLEEWFSK